MRAATQAITIIKRVNPPGIKVRMNRVKIRKALFREPVFLNGKNITCILNVNNVEGAVPYTSGIKRSNTELTVYRCVECVVV